MKQIWREIIFTGLHAQTEQADAQRVRLLNGISFAGSMIFATYLPVSLVLQVTSGIVANILGCLLGVATLYLNHIHFYTSARVFFCIAMTAYLTFSAVLFGSDAGVENILFASFVLPLTLFRNNKALFAAVAFVATAFVIAKLSHQYIPPLYTHEFLEYAYFTNLGFAFIMLFLIVAGFRFEHENYEKEIEKQHDNIKDSVRYAQRIQQAILGSEEEAIRNFSNGFIFFKPKDIVSGDFFWFSQQFVNTTPKKSYRIMIAADCTGHGVPGAFMTVMGNSLLDEIVNERHIVEPSQILRELDKKVINTLQKQSTTQNDGMDMAILVIEERNTGDKFFHFAGAKNPLYYVRNGEIHEIKGAKFPIGSSQFKKEKTFMTSSMPLLDGDIFYLASDGYQDQFGGREAQSRKFMVKKFRHLLERISSLNFNEQRAILEQEFEEWKGKYEQTDDVLVIGLQA
jgi:serine phosphatase RsbU (regulator of sigma subunit)